ncbi:acetyltransferase [Paenibacillus albus]|uniref:Acetyltransferase n=1 Tax=Paenibacillus albus TaxID=2495582 RepID=A0A3Q8X7W4_9BACL|nr:acetyltransferase [Paenibacillus albus]AZN42495.1 acetyltransferase [Paenibacillus albus]
MIDVFIFGSGGHAKVVIDILEKTEGYCIIGLIDGSKPRGTSAYGYTVVGDEEYITKYEGNAMGVVAIGDNWLRSKVVARILKIDNNFKFITAIHPSAVIARGVNIGDGTVVMAGVIINSDTVIGEHCILNTKSAMDHDNTIGDFVTLAPNATTGGNVTIGNYSVLSLSGSIIHAKVIGEHTVIGAGSTVLTDMGSNVVAYGTPARIIRIRAIGEKYL